jgi:hypothetical protein
MASPTITDPDAQVAAVTTPTQARALHTRLKREFGKAMNGEYDDLPEGWEARADAAIGQLDAQVSPSSSGAGGGRRKPATRSPKPAARPGGARGGSRARGRRSGSRSRAGRGLTSVLPGSGGGPVFMSVLYGTLALVVLYVLVRAAEVLPKGKSPIDLFATGLTTGLSVLIAPVDPLAPRAARADGAIANAATVRQVLVGGQPTAAMATPAPRAAAPALSRRPTQTTTR